MRCGSSFLTQPPVTRPIAAQSHLGLGALYPKVDRDIEARAELATTTEMYRSMEIASWLARAETALTEVAR